MGAKSKKGLLLKNATAVDVEGGGLLKADITVINGRFARIAAPGTLKAKGLKAIECKGLYVAPGLVDSHTHTELAMMTVVPFSEMVTAQGTTAAIIDCHDFVNVVGMRGLKLLIRESLNAPLRAFFTVPPCVPSVKGVEDAAGAVSVKDVKKALKFPRVVGLAEVMDTERLLGNDRALLKMAALAKKAGMPVDGHSPSLPERLERRYFKASGAKTDHESTCGEELLRKHGRGAWIHLRKTSFGKEYDCEKVFDKTGGERLMLSSDGCLSPVDILNRGHISAFVRELIAEGVEPVKAIKAATITTAACYGLDREIGSIKEGKRADFLILDDLRNFKVKRTFINGRGVTGKKSKRFGFPAYALSSVRAKAPSQDDIRVTLTGRLKEKKEVDVNVIGLKSGSLLTEKRILKLRNSSGELAPDAGRDILKAVVMERFSGKGRPVIGFVQGFGLKAGAFGGSIGQDCQHITVIGCNDGDISSVIKEIIKKQGGVFYSKGGKIVSGLKLPVGGIMSDERPEKIAHKLGSMEKTLKENGCKAKSPYLALSLQITLAAIPDLKMTNKGLLDVRKRRFISVTKEGNS